LLNRPGEPTAVSGTHGNGRNASRDHLTDEGSIPSSSTLGDSQNSAVSLVEIDRVLRVPMPFSASPKPSSHMPAQAPQLLVASRKPSVVMPSRELTCSTMGCAKLAPGRARHGSRDRAESGLMVRRSAALAFASLPSPNRQREATRQEP